MFIGGLSWQTTTGKSVYEFIDKLNNNFQIILMRTQFQRGDCGTCICVYVYDTVCVSTHTYNGLVQQCSLRLASAIVHITHSITNNPYILGMHRISGNIRNPANEIRQI
jgi:hypothetical protein